MAKRILVDTVITQIIKDGYYKPKSPMFTIVNDGDRIIYLHGNYSIRPGGSFTVNVDAIVAQAIEKGITVENETTYQITFSDDPVGNSRLSGQLIEVYIKME